MLVFDANPDSTPEVTIAIPTFRRPELLAIAIASAFAQKADLEFEIVVVDNDTPLENAPDLVLEACKRAGGNRIRLFRNPENVGMVGNWNRCLNLARGRYLSILNDDDQLLENFLEVMLPLVRGERMLIGKAPSIPVGQVASGVDSSFGGVRPVEFRDLFIGNPVAGGIGMLMFREAALAIGGYDPQMHPAFDYDFNCRYISSFGGDFVDCNVAVYGIGVNESMNVPTLDAFSHRDRLIRRKLLELGPLTGLQRAVANWLDRHLVVLNSCDQYLRMNPDYDATTILVSQGLRRWPRWSLQITRKPILVVFRRLFRNVGFPRTEPDHDRRY